MFRKTLIALTAAGMLLGLAATVPASASARVVGHDCVKTGTNPACTAQEGFEHPELLTVHVRTSHAHQHVTVKWSVTCYNGHVYKTMRKPARGFISPVRDHIHHPFTYPQTCGVTAWAKLWGRRWIHVWVSDANYGTPAAQTQVNCHIRWHLDFYARPHPHMRFHYTHIASNCHLFKTEAELRCVYPPHAVIVKTWYGNPVHTVGPYSRTRCKAITVGTHHNVNGGAIWVGYRYFHDGKWHPVKVLPK